MNRFSFLTIFVSVLVLFTSGISFSQTEPVLPEGYDWKQNPDNGHYYAYDGDNKNWEAAKNYAESLGGYLVTITSAEEDEWLYNTFSEIAIEYIRLGLYKIDSTWAWVTDESIEYTNWKNDDDGGPTAYLDYANGPQWYKRSVNHAYNFIIEIGSFESLPTPTPLITPTPTPTPELWSSLNGDTLEVNSLVADAPTGFNKGKVSFGEIPTGTGTDGKGMEIKLAPGQGAFIVSLEQFDSASLTHISGSFRSSNKNGAVALVALNSPIDGQIGYTNIVSEEIPVDDYRQFNLIYKPPSGKLQFAIQAVNYTYSTISTTVWVDNLNVEPFTPIVDSESVDLNVDGNFEGGLEELIVNINGDDGTIVPFFESLTDIALRMSIKPEETAANIGTSCSGIYEQFPMRLLGQVSVQRDSLPGGGMMGFVITNGFQNLGMFQFADVIPDLNAPQPEYMMIGGDFTVNNPDIPISTFVQIGGPNADVSVVVDDLMILKQ